MKIIPLSEGSFTIDSSKQFVPFNQDADDLQQRPTGSLLVEVQPFAVVTENDVLLLDTGLGFSKNKELQLYSNLKAAGIEPDSVTKVLLTHLHKDHAGAVAVEDRLTSLRSLSFPQATYYVQESELNYAFEKGMPSYDTEELSALKEHSGLVLLTDEEGTIGNTIRYKLTGGHSPCHQVFWITENEETLFFGGDEAPQLQQMKNKFIAKYDHDGRKAMEWRQEWWEQGNAEGWTFLFYHDVKTPTYKKEN